MQYNIQAKGTVSKIKTIDKVEITTKKTNRTGFDDFRVTPNIVC